MSIDQLPFNPIKLEKDGQLEKVISVVKDAIEKKASYCYLDDIDFSSDIYHMLWERGYKVTHGWEFTDDGYPKQRTYIELRPGSTSHLFGKPAYEVFELVAKDNDNYKEHIHVYSSLQHATNAAKYHDNVKIVRRPIME